jgi:Na+/pantothenate symporter
VVNALTIFYTLLGVGLFVPLVGGLYVARTTTRSAMASIVAGVAGMLIVQAATGGQGWGALTPALAGLTAALAAWGITLLFTTRLGAEA